MFDTSLCDEANERSWRRIFGQLYGICVRACCYSPISTNKRKRGSTIMRTDPPHTIKHLQICKNIQGYSQPCKQRQIGNHTSRVSAKKHRINKLALLIRLPVPSSLNDVSLRSAMSTILFSEYQLSMKLRRYAMNIRVMMDIINDLRCTDLLIPCFDLASFRIQLVSTALISE